VRTAYPSVIGESEPELAAWERRLRGRPAAARVRMLRLLKAGAAATLGACAPLVGYSPRQLARWWATYRDGGLGALTREPTRPGKASRLTPAALAELAGEMRAGGCGGAAAGARAGRGRRGSSTTATRGSGWTPRWSRRPARPSSCCCRG
jgi:transposase-like protein